MSSTLISADSLEPNMERIGEMSKIHQCRALRYVDEHAVHRVRVQKRTPARTQCTYSALQHKERHTTNRLTAESTENKLGAGT